MARALSLSGLAAVLLASACAATADEVWRDLAIGFDPDSCTMRLFSGAEEIDAATPASGPCFIARPRGGAAAMAAVPRPSGFAVFVVGEARPGADGPACGRVLTVVEATPDGLRQGATLTGVMALCEGEAPEEKERSLLATSLDR